MAIFRMSEADRARAMFLLDSSSDVSNLPTNTTATEEFKVCQPGSIAMTADMSKVYMLSPSGTWEESA